MLNKNMNVVNCYPDAMEQTTNEPEEGEIVDDYELISSDEELCMRQRIRELEAENEEIEQIAVISRSYDIERAARVPTDVSSISSTEFKTPKKRKRHKNKEHKKKSCHHHHSSGHHRHHIAAAHVNKKSTRSHKTRCKRREKLLSRKRIKNNLESADSLNSSISSTSLSDSDCSPRHLYAEEIKDEDDYYDRQGIRDTLRLAVARSRKNSTRQSANKVDLKERLLRKDLEFTGNQFSSPTNVNGFPQDIEEEADDDVVICEPENEIQYVPDDDSADSLEEKELRLIALKSAMLKKHMERKRRNEEAAYSPTDFDDIISSCIVDSDDKLADLEVVDLDDDDSQNACITASPIPSPPLLLLDGQEDSSQLVNCKPVDMDIANSDSEDAAPPSNWDMGMTSMIPFPPLPPNDVNNAYSYGMFMPDFQNSNSMNPPPPGVDDYEETKQILPLNFGKCHEIETQDMEVENDDFEPIAPYTSSSKLQDAQDVAAQELKSNSNTASLHSDPMEDDNQEEEEQALRALLLSKFNSPKNQKKHAVAASNAVEMEKENSLAHKTNKESTKNTVKPTEAILKEAVKRLKVVEKRSVEYRREILPQWEQTLQDERRREEYNNKSPNEWECSNDAIDLPLAVSSVNKEKPSNALECLQRKVKELKNHREPKAMQTNGFGLEEKIDHKSAFVQIVKEKHFNATTTAHRDSDIRLPTTVNDVTEEPGHKFLTNNINDTLQFKRKRSEKNDTAESIPSVCVVNHNLSLDEDTKRRLQKLKDEILNATLMATNTQLIPPHTQLEELPSAVVEESIENGKITRENTTKPIVESKETKDTTFKPPVEDRPQPHKDTTLLTATKIKAPANANKNKAPAVVHNNTALKENNLNKGNKNSHKSNTDLTESIKSQQETKKVTSTPPRITVAAFAKEAKSPAQNKLQSQVATKSLPVASQVSPKSLPTYSVLRTTKIVKPNKVINKNIDLKRKVVLIKSDASAGAAAKIIRTEASAAATAEAASRKTLDTSRLITSMEQVRHMCNVAQLVISVQNSSNESSEDEWADCDAMYKPLHDYNDIASPLSLNLESPCFTPIRSNSPVEGGIEEKTNNSVKPKRSPITFAKEKATVVSPKTPLMVHKPLAQNVKTPVAVRHLPAAAQDEYRKLVHRMKLLENQRHKKEGNTSVNEDISKTLSTSNDKIEQDSAPAAVKSTLVKQVLLRNTNNKTTSTNSSSESALTKSNDQPAALKPNKANILKSYESLYVKIGAGIVNNLEKSLRLVEEAKLAKIRKLKVEKRLNELKHEMELLQKVHKEDEQKIARIYPSICTTNEVITSMKQKRSKIFKAANNLGKSLKGEEYRLNNELKQSITSKSRKLASEIKIVNSLKAYDVYQLEMDQQPTISDAMVDSQNVKEISNAVESSVPIGADLSSCNKDSASEVIEEDTQELKKTEDNGNNSKSSSPNCVDNKKLDDDEENEGTPKDCPQEANNAVEEVRKDEHESDKSTETRNDDVLSESSLHNGGNTEFQVATMDASNCDIDNSISGTGATALVVKEEMLQLEDRNDDKDVEPAKNESDALPSYISPLEHLRNRDGTTMDPNGVVCPYDLMGNCEDATCKYIHISHRDIDGKNNATSCLHVEEF